MSRRAIRNVVAGPVAVDRVAATLGRTGVLAGDRRRGLFARGAALAALLAGGALSVVPLAAGATTTSTGKSESALQRGLDFYRGKTITVIVAGSTGGSADIASRLEAQYMGIYLHATMNIEDVPAGDGVAGADQTASAAPDGLTIGTMNSATNISLALTDQPGLSFNPERVEWITANAQGTTLMLASTSSPYTSFKSVEDARPPATFMLQASGVVTVDMSSLMGVLGIPVHWLTGYATVGSYLQGFTRGDAPIMAVNLADAGPFVAGGKARAILASSVPAPGTTYRQYVVGVPTVASLLKERPAKSKKQKEEYAAVSAFINGSNDPLITQTSVAAYKLTALRAAASWMAKQAALKTAMLTAGESPDFFDPVVAKENYITALEDGKYLVPFFTHI